MITPEWDWCGRGVRERVQIRLESDRDWKTERPYEQGINVEGERLTLAY